MNAISFDVLENLALCVIEIIEFSSNILWKKKLSKKLYKTDNVRIETRSHNYCCREKQ
jgi:hypothetical protein